MIRGALTAAAVLAVVAALAGQSPGTATITGHVTLTARVRGTALPSNVYQPRAVSTHAAGTIPEIKNVVVYLKGVTFAGRLPVSHQEIHQEHEAFAPRVVAVTRGSTVEFPNFDPVFHNVFSLSSASTFDLGRYPMGHSKSATFSKAGLVKVYCHIHSQMSASILVLDHPYFTIPEADGSFTLPNVPAGSFTIVGWHERIGERTGTVTVEAGRTASIDLSLPVEDQP
jgi:plastocyanin